MERERGGEKGKSEAEERRGGEKGRGEEERRGGRRGGEKGRREGEGEGEGEGEEKQVRDTKAYVYACTYVLDFQSFYLFFFFRLSQ